MLPSSTAMGEAFTRLPCIAITGGIGSGKSAALAAFGRLGAAVLSADEIVHALYRQEDVVSLVADRFGQDLVTDSGEIDRATLGSRAFKDPEAMSFLEGVLHPRIGRWRVAWQERMRALVPSPTLLVCEVPLVFEAGLERDYDAVLVVTASDDIRRARVEARGQRFDERRARQLPEAEKVARADASYVNDGSLAELDAWVAGCMARYGTSPALG